jgi:N-hydroxyarylamine O-acetyltransferase
VTIDDYLRRIGIKQRPERNLAGLTAVHRAHMMSIPYENLDVQLGRSVDISVANAFDKIVHRRRGGWCYEMNGLMGYALAELGFDVTRLAGAVMREVRGELSLCNHLVTKVDLDEGEYLADVGFGEGSLDPIRLVPGEFLSNGFKFSLSQEDHGWWRMHKYLPASRRSFDFSMHPADEACFASRCAELQTASDSIFVQNLICYRHFEGGYNNLLGRVLRRVESTENIERTEVTERLVEDAGDLVSTLKDIFGLDVPEAAGLWPKIAARHEEVLREQA